MRTIYAALLAVFCGMGPLAAQPTRTEEILVCQTLVQAVRFAELGANKSAIEVINKEFRPDACMAIKVAFAIRRPVGKIRHGFETFLIVEILVLGINDGRQIQRLLSPVVWYTFMQPGKDV